MKKTLFAFLALAAAFAATSCQSDEELTQPTGKPMVINAVAEGIGTGTRATMAYKYDILWSEGDQIMVKGDSKSATFDLQSGKGTTEGTFECKGSPFASGDAVEAFYPATLVKDGSLEWPAEQTTSTVIPMYSKQTLGSADEENFSFASLGAMLQIVFTTSQADVTLKSITLKDGTNALSGTFTVDDDGKAGITATDKAGITLDLGDGVPVGLAAKYFNIAVPAGKYSDLSITFTATDNSTCTFVNGSATLTHNTVGRLVLTGTKFKLPFGQGTAEVNASAGITGNKVKWIQLWENGPKFAEYNVGATSPTEVGGYYTWGGTYKNGTGITWTDDHNTDNTGEGNLTGTDDTATKLWGSNWRMPTSQELSDLLSNCTCTWTDSPAGLLCKGKEGTAYAGNSVFLPAAGRCGTGNVYSQGALGYYWSSTPYGSDFAYYLYFNWGSNQNVDNEHRSRGCSVRAVLNEKVNGHDYVELAGYKWATENVGAVKEGDTPLYNATDATYGYYYNQENASKAAESWGGTWTLPTETQWEALMDADNCTWTWTKQDGKDGYIVSDKNDDSKFIFLPAAGIFDVSSDVFRFQGDDGVYWSADTEWCLDFDNDERGLYGNDPTRGLAVRLVSQ